jgi:hypothetical protein
MEFTETGNNVYLLSKPYKHTKEAAQKDKSPVSDISNNSKIAFRISSVMGNFCTGGWPNFLAIPLLISETSQFFSKGFGKFASTF